MYRLYVKRKGRIVAEFYRSGNVDAYYKFSQMFHDAEIGDTVIVVTTSTRLEKLDDIRG